MGDICGGVIPHDVVEPPTMAPQLKASPSPVPTHPDDCPHCGGGTVNVQGLVACPECGWTTN